MVAASAVDVEPRAKANCASGAASIASTNDAGIMARVARRAPVRNSARRSSSRPSDACVLIFGSSAVIRDTPITA